MLNDERGSGPQLRITNYELPKPPGGLDHLSWDQLMELIARKAGGPLTSYVVVVTVEGQPTRFGVNYGRTPLVRAVLKANLQRCLAEMARLSPPGQR